MLTKCLPQIVWTIIFCVTTFYVSIPMIVWRCIGFSYGSILVNIVCMSHPTKASFFVMMAHVCTDLILFIHPVCRVILKVERSLYLKIVNMVSCILKRLIFVMCV